MGKIKNGARKVVVALVGIPLLLMGLVLVPLPGPGLVVIALALLLLSSEFTWAEKHYLRAKQAVEKIVAEAKRKQQKYLDKLDEKDKK